MNAASRCRILVLVVASCGGQVERGGEPSPDPDPGDQAPGPGAGADPGLEGSPLGPCVKGFDRSQSSGKPCNWLAEELCYDTKAAACACVCPPSGSSVCVSGFDNGPGAATPVSCD